VYVSPFVTVADMVPVMPPSVLFHANATGAPLGETEPVPVPVVVHALSATPAHSSAESAKLRPPVCVSVFNAVILS
jgi:hypothetical protein